MLVWHSACFGCFAQTKKKQKKNCVCLVFVNILGWGPVIPRSLPEELVMGEHFVLSDLLKSIPGNSTEGGFAQELQAETAQETSATFARPGQSPLDEQDSRPALQVAKKKKMKKKKKKNKKKRRRRRRRRRKKKKKKKGKIITSGAGLEGFVDWLDPNASDPVEKREDDMSNLAARFTV